MKKLNIPVLVTELKKRISSYILPGNSPGLEQQQIYGIMLAAVGASNATNFVEVIESVISEYVDQETINTAKSAAEFVKSSVHNKNLPYMEAYIVIESDNDDCLRTTHGPHTRVAETNYIDDMDFMLYVLVASFVADFDYYINIRDQLVDGDHIDNITISSAVRIAASFQTISELFEHKVKVAQKIKILIVDDEVRLLRLLKLILIRTDKFEVRTENRGSNALNTARAFKPDLILLDIIMPDMGGDKVAQQIKEDKELRHTRVVFLTALLSKEETGNTGRKIGGYWCLAKPVRENDLIYCIEKKLSHLVAAY